MNSNIFYDVEQHEKELPEGRDVSRRLSAYARIENNSGQILLVNPTSDSAWEFPGGGIEIKEHIAEAVIRECMEETGYVLEKSSPLPFHIEEGNFYDRSTDQYFHTILFFYTGTINTDMQQLNAIDRKEIREVTWMHPDEIKKVSFRPSHKTALEKTL